MDATELKNLQAPLKEKYKSEPGSAIITLKAQGNVGEGISCSVETGRALVEAGLHPATGGTGLLACSGDLLLQALVACAGVTLKALRMCGVDMGAGAKALFFRPAAITESAAMEIATQTKIANGHGRTRSLVGIQLNLALPRRGGVRG